MTLYYYDSNNVLHTLIVNESDSSFRQRGLMQRPQMTLKFSLPTYVEIPVGAYCDYQGERFTLLAPQNIKKQGTRNIEYTMTMGTYQDNLTLYKMRNSVDGRLKYSMCSTPAEFVAEIVANLNARDGAGVWHVGFCIDTTPRTIEFNHTYIDAALQQVADEFETEWEIVDHYISLHTVSYNDKEPLPLSYGKGNGFVPGVGRTTPTGEQPVKRLYVQGGDRNIDYSTYGHKDLILPLSQRLQWEGREYESSADGMYVERVDELTDSSKEDSIDCSDLYPSRVGTVSQLDVVDADRNLYDFRDSSIPSDLDYDDYLIDGETMTVIFQTGMLAGKEFDLQKYVHAERRFEIMPFEYDGVTMPNNTFKPAVGDTYIIFGCTLPDAYICDNNTRTGASWDMFRQAAHYLRENEDPKFNFTGKLQGKWTRENWATVGGKLVVGGHVLFSDTQFAPNGTDIRIIGIKDYLTDPYAPTIDLSNGVTGQSVTTTLVQVGSNEVTIGEAYNNSINFTKRRFRDAMDTMIMLQESLLDFSESINPITVQTMQALIGDASLQFIFEDVNGTVWPQSAIFYFNNDTKRLSVTNPSDSEPQSPLLLKHTEFGNTIQPGHEYMNWEMTTPFVSSVLSNEGQGYYLYAKCEANSAVMIPIGEFVLSSTAIAMDSVSGYYHFLVGILGKEHNGERSFVTLYGFTELLPGRVTTDLIISSDASSFFDLASGHIQANSAYIRGTIRSPFHKEFYDTEPFEKYDNLIVNSGYPYPNTPRPLQLRWDRSQSGRKMNLVGTGYIVIPDGMRIYEDGSELVGVSLGRPATFYFYNEIVTIVGYGDAEEDENGVFHGWIVTSRHQIDVFGNLVNYYGKGLHALAFGNVYVVKTNDNEQSITELRMAHSTFDGSTLTISRVSTGIYQLSVPMEWFGGSDNSTFVIYNCLVEVTSQSGGAYHIGVLDKVYDNTTQRLIIVFNSVNYDGITVDCNFSFVIYNTRMWNNLQLPTY